MSMAIQMLFGIGSVLVFRVLLNRFCEQVEPKKRLAYAAGMMLAYTAVMMSLIYMAGSIMPEQMSVQDFSIYMCVLIFAVNIVVGFIIIVYCTTARRRSLSNREKIMLKDL